MLEYCLGYHNIPSDYDNSKTSEIIVTFDDWEKGFAFLKFLKVFMILLKCVLLYILLHLV